MTTGQRSCLIFLLVILLSPLLAGFLGLYAPRNLEFLSTQRSSFSDHPQLQHTELKICSPTTSAARNAGDINPCSERERGCPAGSLRLAASFVRPPAGTPPTPNHNATIVVVHGHGSHRHRRMGRQWSIVEKAVVPLAQAGYNVLAIDLRNHGASDTYGPVTFGVLESLDVAAAVEYSQTCLSLAHNLDGDRVGLYAESMGAAASLIAVGQYGLRDLRAVWAESSFTTLHQAVFFRLEQKLGLPHALVEAIWVCMEFLGRLIASVKLHHADPLSFIPFIEVPLTISHGSLDQIVSYQQGQQIWEAARVASELTGKPPVVDSFWYHGHHTEAYLDNRMPEALIAFFNKHV